MLRIYIDDLVPNAFITYLQHSNPKNFNRKLSLCQIEKFGKSIENNLRYKNIDAYLILSQDIIVKFFNTYVDWFRLQDDDIVVLNDLVTIDNLIKNFTKHLPIELSIEFSKRKNYLILFGKK